MARVFEARRMSLAGVNPRVAIKVILPDLEKDDTFRDLFVQEARIGSWLHHPNLVQIQDFDEEDGHFYLVMEYVEGLHVRRLSRLCLQYGMILPLHFIAEVGRQVCSALAYLHGARAEDGSPVPLVHQDIKPHNIMVTPQGMVKVLDFGTAKTLGSHDSNQMVLGTWGYMSPEQAGGRPVDGRSDQFSLATVLYEMATRQKLFPHKSASRLYEAMERDAGVTRALGLDGNYEALGPVLARALHRDPEARYPDAEAMGKALSALAADNRMARDGFRSFTQMLWELQGDGAASAAGPGASDPPTPAAPPSRTPRAPDPRRLSSSSSKPPVASRRGERTAGTNRDADARTAGDPSDISLSDPFAARRTSPPTHPTLLPDTGAVSAVRPRLPYRPTAPFHDGPCRAGEPGERNHGAIPSLCALLAAAMLLYTGFLALTPSGTEPRSPARHHAPTVHRLGPTATAEPVTRDGSGG